MANSLPFFYLEKELVDRMSRPTHPREKFLELSCVFARITVRDRATGEVATCAICHEEMEVSALDTDFSANRHVVVSDKLPADHNVEVEECEHFFHRDCLLESTKYSPRCPNCRQLWFDSPQQRRDNLELKDTIAFARSEDYDDHDAYAARKVFIHAKDLVHDILTAAYCIMTDISSRVYPTEATHFPRGVGASREAHAAVAALMPFARRNEGKYMTGEELVLGALEDVDAYLGPNTERLKPVRMFVVKTMLLGMSINVAHNA